jgi:hypothetical protein
MDKKIGTSKKKTSQRKSRAKKQGRAVDASVDQGDEVQQELRKWFEENRSLDPLALYAKFYSRF